MITLIHELSDILAVSGREQPVRDFLISRLPKDVTYRTDAMGNLFVSKKGTKGAGKNKVMVCAHMDEVGLIITYITDEGYLKFAGVGGIDPAVLIGRTVVLESGVPGVIGLKHIHICSKEEQQKIPEMKDLCIDIGAHSKEEAARYATLGSYACFQSNFVEFGSNNNRIKAKALDDRVGCAFMLKLIQSELDYDTEFVFTVQEEVGARGAGPAAFQVEPDVALILESTTAGDICDVTGNKRACVLGEGPVVSYMDRGTVYDMDLYKTAFAVAEEKGIPCQTKTLVAGGNDSSSVQSAGAGSRVLAISVPTRYLHSPVCIMDKTDITSTMQLVEALLPVVAND